MKASGDLINLGSGLHFPVDSVGNIGYSFELVD